MYRVTVPESEGGVGLFYNPATAEQPRTLTSFGRQVRFIAVSYVALAIALFIHGIVVRPDNVPWRDAFEEMPTWGIVVIAALTVWTLIITLPIIFKKRPVVPGQEPLTPDALRAKLSETLIVEFGDKPEFSLLRPYFTAGCQEATFREFTDQDNLAKAAELQLDILPYLKQLYGTDDLVKFYADIFIKAFAVFCGQLPPFLKGKGLFHIPLLEALPHTKSIDDFFHSFKRADKALWREYLTYVQNHYAAEESVKARFYELNSIRHFEKLAQGTAFESLFEKGQAELPVEIPEQLRFEGLWVIAPPGRGKTTLLSTLLKDDLRKVRDGSASIILMDSKGDLIDHARRLKEFSPEGELAGKLVLIEPNENLALNPLDLGATAGHRLALCEYILDGLMDMGTTSKQGTVFRRALIGVQTIPGATFETFLRFLHDWRPYEEHVKKLDPDDRDFFFGGRFDEKQFKDTRTELGWRIDGMMTKIPLVRSMLKAPSTKLDLGKEMDAGKVIIIDNSAAKLAAGTEFFSRFFVALILAAAQQRAGRKDDDKLPCYFYIDECDTVVARDTKIADILDRCRSQKIGLVLAHQRLKQIDNEKVMDAISNSAVRFANSDDDASALSSKMRTTPQELHSLKRGQFALFIRDNTKKAIIVNVPNEPVSGWEKMPDADFYKIQRMMEERYCYTPIGEAIEAVEPTEILGDPMLE